MDSAANIEKKKHLTKNRFLPLKEFYVTIKKYFLNFKNNLYSKCLPHHLLKFG